jgi:aldehyde:ferredoxin oxidoreductase
MQPILEINLTSKTHTTILIPEDWQRDYIGAASLAARILYEQIYLDLDPLSPDAPLLFLTGPLTGTAGPSVGRFVICARSPATGLWGESNCGGFWGPELRKAGFDGLLLTGRADSHVYLWIHDQTIEVKDARHIWGMDTYQTQESIVKELAVKKPRIAVIGPAGESEIPMSVILTDHGRVGGRTGMGAVMGSKNLKAVAVKGNGTVPYARDVYPKLRSAVNRVLRGDNFSRAARETGTAGIADYADYLGEMPKKYFQSGIFDGAYNVSGSSMSETILKGEKACHACVIACGRVVQLSGKELTQKGPEYETIVGFGPNLCIDDLEFITQMGDLCDRFGVDTISLSNTLGLAFTLYEQGIITETDTNGHQLIWGDKFVVEKIITETVHQQGFGATLSEGALALGRKWGVEGFAVQVNGLEVPYHDPRGGSGIALSYATSPRGACHNQSDYFLADLYGSIETRLGMEFFERHVGVEKVNNVVIHQNWRSLFNALVMCLFANVSPLKVLELVNAGSGQDYTLDDLLLVGERAWNLKRAINIRLGLRRENDRLPSALLKPYLEGGAAGYVIPFEEMLEEYYRIREWDPETGYPSYGKLAELGLEWIEF